MNQDTIYNIYKYKQNKCLITQSLFDDFRKSQDFRRRILFSMLDFTCE